MKLGDEGGGVDLGVIKGKNLEYVWSKYVV